MANFLKRLFKTDQRLLKKVAEKAKLVDQFKDSMRALSDDDLKAKTPYFKKLLSEGKTLDDILPEAFAVAREAAFRVIKEYPYFVQIMGAIVLHQGDVAEMKTGEGKTLTATMAVYLNALAGKGIHVITVNEYLAKRDAEWMGSIYRFLGLTVGVNLRDLTPLQKKEAYLCDVTYSTNSEAGFDYLRDNMATDKSRRVLRPLETAIIDEADSILIDESRTPLIISGGSRQGANMYIQANRFAKSLTKDKHYEIDIKAKTVSLTDAGNHYAEKAFGIANLYNLEYTELVHYIHQAMKANFIMQRDVDYVVAEGQIVIVDQFTGRLLKGRQYSDGLHQAIEAKENVKVNPETQTMATITYQNFFRLYNKLAGMTGTAKTEEDEFISIYNMRVMEIPTNKPVIRKDYSDFMFAYKKDKYGALVNEIKERHGKGQPILVGTIAVETSELISDLLKVEKISHEVLNAKNHAREAEIIAKAGQIGAVTIATNMAGRGTDIKLGPGVRELGGLAVLGSERHESRRIDNQLRGRSGRQGDPGESRFFVSFEDELLLRFGGERAQKILQTMNPGSELLESKMLTGFVTNAQKQVEGRNFDIRKTLLEYDDVLRKQREIMYQQRDTVLFADEVHFMIDDIFHKVANQFIDQHTNRESKDPKLDVTTLVPALLHRYFPTITNLPSIFEKLTIDEAKEKLYQMLITPFMARKQQWGPDIFNLIEKQVLIRMIDTHWTAHIDKMARLRDGIQLRAYANTNPLHSYVNEGYDLFQKMANRIAEDTVQYCLFTEVKIEKRPVPTTPSDAAKGANA